MEEKGGCGVAVLGLALVAGLVLVMWGLSVYGQAQDAQAQRIYAEQALVVAQGQARMDAAQATAVTSAAMFPWLVMGMIGLGSIGMVGAAVTLAFVALSRRQAMQPMPQPLIILLPADAGRREMAQLIGPRLSHSAVEIIEQERAQKWG
jgi:hypothetical protein